MKTKTLTLALLLMATLTLRVTNSYAQSKSYDAQTIIDVLTYNRMVETKRMVDLNPKQEKIYKSCCLVYYQKNYHAIHEIGSTTETCEMIYNAKKVLADTLMSILNEKQRATYIRNTGAEEVKHKTLEKMMHLKNSNEYSEEELENAYHEIYEYLMLEKIAYIQHKYNIAKQKENIAQLKTREPRALKNANAQQKLQRKGKAHQYGNKW